MVLASYMRTLVSDLAPVDQGTMTPDQVTGLNLFRTRCCATCHANGGIIEFNGATQTFSDPRDLLFSDGLAHNIQLVGHNSFPPSFPNDGFGRGVKTPTLRNVAVTGPYMHNGVFKDLRTVVLFYNKYNSKSSKRQINPETGKKWRSPEVAENISLKELETGPALKNKRIDALVAFMKTLTDSRYEYLLGTQP